ncbi:MAG: twin-arginine translocation signal domain-containing protein [Pirellulales bacterium]|nr:twin-arginine translocation signal domain-containing protein [Pirellulales bacterium]
MSGSEDRENRQKPVVSRQPQQQSGRCGEPGCCRSADPSRRQFLKAAGASAASLTVVGGPSVFAKAVAVQGRKLSDDHFVPVDKQFDPAWLKSLTAKGDRAVYQGDDLAAIAMPIGGICTGQVYLSGDGCLVHWDVFNIRNFTGYGATCYDLGRTIDSPLQQGFAVRVRSGAKTVVRPLDRRGFPGVRFCGEYPIATVEYRDKDVPVSVTLEAFSPFIPVNVDDSGLPTTLMQYTVTNISDEPAEVTLAGWLENAVCCQSSNEMHGNHANRLMKRGPMTTLLSEARPAEAPPAQRPAIVLADFEGDDYGDWTVEGEAFGKGPARGTLDRQQAVSGFQGKGLVNTYLGGDDHLTGKLTSPEFTIERRFLSFLIAGGKVAEKTCINLLVDGQVVRTATGDQTEVLKPHNWNVADLAGKQARIEIVDRSTEGWGHVNIDQIELRDQPRTKGTGPLDSQPDFGTMALAVIQGDGETLATASLPDGPLPEKLFAEDGLADGGGGEKPFGTPLCGALGKMQTLQPGQSARVTFALTWHFPNRPEHGNYYTKRFKTAAAVAAYVADNLDRLVGQTRLWHNTWYDSTLPHWLLDRLFSTVSTLATSTCQRWENGRFWAWEGVGCCHGTCTHVWNYEHAMARLFPELERSCREMQDYGAGFVEESGMVRFRGEGWGMWAGDGQAGTVLKAYREHQVAADDAFLKRNWTKIRKSLEFLIREDRQDGLPDGLLEGSQHNTYDINFFGANTMVGSLYLAALRAGEAMAVEMGDDDFSEDCRKMFASGSKLTVEKLFNGEYFVQDVDLQQHDKHQYGDGCLSDQLFGQGWAHQVGLGYVYPQDKVTAALRSVWKYNWAPDIGPQNAVHKPERWFARDGEAGLFTCTWPFSPHLSAGVRYKNEVWTGIEYQVAGNMAWEGLVTEALAICRGVHDRYHPAKHNPWNEVECGDHYARAMASHGVFLGLCGFEYHGPKAHLGFAPRITPEDFRAAFTAAEGWGTLSQKRSAERQSAASPQINRIDVRWGKLCVKTLALQLPEGAQLRDTTVTLAQKPIQAEAEQDGQRVVVSLAAPVVVEEDQSLEVAMTF